MRLRDSTLQRALSLTLAMVAISYWLLTAYVGLADSVGLKMALTLGLAAVAGGGWWIALISSTEVAAEFQKRHSSRWASILGPFGAVQFFSGLILVFWVADYPPYVSLATCAALASGALSTVIRLHRYTRERGN